MCLFVSNVAKLSLSVSFLFFGGCCVAKLSLFVAVVSLFVAFWFLWRCWVSRFVAFSCLCVSLSLCVTTSLFLDSFCLCSMSLYVLTCIFLSCVFCWASQVVFNYVVLCVCWCLCLSLDVFCCLLGSFPEHFLGRAFWSSRDYKSGPVLKIWSGSR